MGDADTKLRSMVTELARSAGQEPWHGAYGASGNISVKHEGRLYITRTGVKLGQAGPEDVSVVPLEDVHHFIRKVQHMDFIDKIRGVREFAHLFSPRPSSEVFFHAVLPGKVVLHTHHIGVLRATPYWREVQDAAVVPYAPIGIELCEAMSGVDTSAGMLLLQNHGVVLQGDDINDVRERFFALDHVFGRGTFETPQVGEHENGFLIHGPFMDTSIFFSPLLGDYVFSCGPEPLSSLTDEARHSFRNKWGVSPRIALMESGDLLALVHEREQAVEMAEVLRAHELMWDRVPSLSNGEVRRLVNMLQVLVD